MCSPLKNAPRILINPRLNLKVKIFNKTFLIKFMCSEFFEEKKKYSTVLNHIISLRFHNFFFFEICRSNIKHWRLRLIEFDNEMKNKIIGR